MSDSDSHAAAFGTFVGSNVGSGLIAMAIWFFSTHQEPVLDPYTLKPRVDPVTGEIVTYTAQGLDMPLSEFATIVGVVGLIISVILAWIVASRPKPQ
jgi:hypothetical protein